MSQVPIIRRRRGPITRAIYELDDRTRGLVIAPNPGIRVAQTSSGTVITVLNQNQGSRRQFSGGGVWR